ncbi:MAG TPA: ribbon-helix-helix domain-containing protein [Longimicrobium sp.]|jgi:metal-responsive CopG/Arc/MetJ family transcriptional regulator
MPKIRIRISLETSLLRQIDALVRQCHFASRSDAVESLLREHLACDRLTRLAEACGQLDGVEESALAEAGIDADAAAWPDY